MTAPITLSLVSGASARVLQTDGIVATISSPQASPPGSTVRGTIEGVGSEFQLKVRSCKKVDERFHIDGKLKNATREMKAFLAPTE